MVMGGEAAAMMANTTFVNLDRKYSSNASGEDSYELHLQPQQRRDLALVGF